MLLYTRLLAKVVSSPSASRCAPKVTYLRDSSQYTFLGAESAGQHAIVGTDTGSASASARSGVHHSHEQDEKFKPHSFAGKFIQNSPAIVFRHETLAAACWHTKFFGAATLVDH